MPPSADPSPSALCPCLTAPGRFLRIDRDLGMDERFADAAMRVARPGAYEYEVEAFTASGRWYLGPVTARQAEELTASQAKTTLESLDWYYYGGSYFDGRIGKASGDILLNP